MLIEEGRLLITGPPTINIVDMISVQFVPPMPSVSKTWPDDRVNPVFEFTAYTLRSRIVSDILSLVHRKLNAGFVL